ncbi:uncharacterized protein BT62DRAFT_990804 [Guyanagaster necrorhizus]|uniref:Uncharacterized protein n=1 Tax=Guyanagaster necrorhizus TaxID=856835 RepID=A0A9P7W396_9AGAR|nr:uncharacterized protein BT62DRAFT_990804 [Guyanagaster necrorhizus MCA 3950]KAG7451170.1 hypothetical protein BT62DRAFT_990804 [Guyanagaster necrorhizus MCA 3950]
MSHARKLHFTDFLRSHTSHRQASNEPSSSSLVYGGEPVLEPPNKSKSSRIPFLGRARKKSTVSDGRTTFESRNIDDGQRPTSLTDEINALPSDSSVSHSHSHASTSASDAHSLLNSKIAVRVAHSIPKSTNKPTRLPSHSPSINGYTSDSLLSPPSSLRPTSIGTTISDSNRKHRSAMPRPKQPTITVSLTPDNLSEYGDLFTQPRNKFSPTNQQPSTRDDRAYQSDTQIKSLPRLSSPEIPPLPKSPPVKLRDTRSYTDDAVSLKSTRSTRRHRVEDGSRHSDEESETLSTPPMPSLPGHRTSLETRRMLGSIPYSSQEQRPSHLAKGVSPHEPPTIPLPEPPLRSLPDVPSLTTSAGPTSIVNGRRRAHTMSSVSLPPIPYSPSFPPLSPCGSFDRRLDDERSNKENDDLDIDSASVEQLRQALKDRSQQVDQLLKAAKAYLSEKTELEQKISLLEREAARREKEIQGLTWLVNNRGAAVGESPMILAASKSTSALQAEKSTFSPSSPTKSKNPAYRYLNADYDSGGESHQTSGGESTTAVRTPRPKRYSKVSEKSTLSQRSSLRNGGTAGCDTSIPSVPTLDKRTSVSSVAFSAASTSSTSSLMPASSSTSTLSVIPEDVLPPLPRRQASVSSPSSRDPAIMAAIIRSREKDQKRTSKPPMSVPSASAPTPAAAYAANLKQGPSIAQVLAHP